MPLQGAQLHFPSVSCPFLKGSGHQFHLPTNFLAELLTVQRSTTASSPSLAKGNRDFLDNWKSP